MKANIMELNAIKTLLILLFCASSAFAEIELLLPVKTDSPRDTMKTFMENMEDYRKGVETHDEQLLSHIKGAIRTLDLSDREMSFREQWGKEAAIYLKETIDRVIVINYELIPEASPDPKKKLLRWRLKDTEIVISLVQNGDRAGEYLFSKDTVHRSKEFFEKVKHLPYLEGAGKGAGYESPWVEQYVPYWMQDKTLGYFRWQWAGIFISILLGLFVKTLCQWAMELSKKVTSRSKNDLDDRIIDATERPIGLIGAATFWYICLYALRLEGRTLVVLTVVIKSLFAIAIIWMVYRLTEIVSEYLRVLAKRSDIDLDDQLVPLLIRALKVFVVVFGSLVAIQNLGVNVASLLAGLGLGGLAFALAAKDTVSNLFGSITILWDRPFRMGDWVVVNGSAEGTVEEIGFRSTRIRTFYDSLISVPNSIVANAKVDNMGRRAFRRVKTNLGLTYDTPPEKMEAFLEGVKNIIKANPNTRKDYFHVVFNNYGASSLDILLYFFLKVPDWSSELVERQNVFLEIYRLAAELGVDFAYPTQSLHIETFPEKQPVREGHQVDRAQLEQAAQSFGPKGGKAQPSGQGIFTPPHLENDA